MSGNENDERPGGRIRIGDQEREDAVKRLGAHYEAGRLSADEHTERVGEALQAKTEADLAALFADLPGEGRPGEGRPAEGSAEGAEDQGWAGPWGWARPPWTAPEGQGQGGGQGRGGGGPQGPRGAGGPAWAKRGPFGKIPLPVLLAIAAIGVLASIACTVRGGHPPLLPLLLIVAGVFIVRKRRQEYRA